MKNYLLALAAATALTSGAAHAAPNFSQTSTETWITTGDLVYVPQFDSSLGTLKAVNITFQTTSAMNAFAFNATDSSADHSAMLDSSVELGIFFGSTLFSTQPSCSANVTVEAWSGGNLGCSAGSSQSYAFTDATILQQFTTDPFTALLASASYSGADGVTGSTSSTITLNYSYIAAPAVAAVPEPATWAMMAGGFAMVGAAARRRRRVALTV